jgi:hypothetical protein
VGSAIVTIIGDAAAEQANDIPGRVAQFVGTLAQALRAQRREVAP